MSHALFILVCLIWGSSFILMAEARAGFGPIGVAGWRVVCGAAALAFFGWLGRRAARADPPRRWPFARRDLAPLAVIVLLGYGSPYIIQPAVIPVIGSGMMGMMMCLAPLLTLLVSIPMLGSRPTPRQVVGVLGGLVLMTLLMGDAWQAQAPLGSLLLATTVPLGYAIANTLVKRRFAHVTPLALSGWAMALAAVPLVPLSLTLEPAAPAPAPLAALVALGVLSTGLSNFLYYRLVRDIGPVHSSLSSYVIPLVAMGWGWARGERLTPWQLALLLGVLAMVAVAQWRAAPGPGRAPDGASLAAESGAADTLTPAQGPDIPAPPAGASSAHAPRQSSDPPPRP